jgi:hypothetical protein
VIGLRRVVLILVKLNAQQCFGGSAVYARIKKDAAVAPRPNGARMAEYWGFGWCRVRELNSRPTVYKTAALPLS